MFHNIKIIDPDIDDVFNKLDKDHKKLAYYLVQGCKAANYIYSEQIHPDARDLINLFIHLYVNYPKFDPQYDHKILENLKKYTEFLISTHSQYYVDNHKEYPPIDKNTLITLSQLTRYPKSVDNLITRLFDKTDEQLYVDGNVQKSYIGHYRIESSKKSKKYIDTIVDKIHLNSQVCQDEKGLKVRVYSMKDLNSEDMKLAHKWFKLAYEHCIVSKTISPTVVNCLSKLLIFLQEGTIDSLIDYHNSWIKIEGMIDFIFSPFEVYLDPLHKMGSYAGEVTVESINLTNFRKIWQKLENDLPIPDEFKSKNTPGRMSFRTKIYASGANGAMRLISAYCLPNSSNDTKQVIYTYNETNKPYLNKHLMEIIEGDLASFYMNVAYKMHLVLHEWAHATGKFTQYTDGTKITSANLSDYISKDYSSLEELRAETFAIWTFLNNYKDLIGCFDDMKRVDKNLGEMKFKELYTTLVLNDGLRRLASCDGNPIEAHARANMVLTNYVMSHNGLEVIEEPFEFNGKMLYTIGCKIQLDKIPNIIKKLSIQIQTIKSTGNGNANERLFDWFVKNPIGQKRKIYAQKIRDRIIEVVGNERIEVENYPIIEPDLTLKKIGFINAFIYLCN